MYFCFKVANYTLNWLDADGLMEITQIKSQMGWKKIKEIKKSLFLK